MCYFNLIPLNINQQNFIMDLLRIKELLREKNLTGKDLSEKVGVSSVAISNIASGNSFPKPDLLKRIAEELDVDIRDLFISTKEDAKEAVYVLREGNYINIGEINFNQ